MTPVAAVGNITMGVIIVYRMDIRPTDEDQRPYVLSHNNGDNIRGRWDTVEKARSKAETILEKRWANR